MSCTNAYFGGSSECTELLKNAVGFVLQEKGNTWTRATIVGLTNWHTVIADDDSAVRNALPLPFLYFENTTDEPEIISAPGSGKKSKGSDPIPSGVIYLKSGLDGYLQMHGLKGSEYEIFPFFEDGTFWATEKSDGNLKGFRCSVDTNAGFARDDKNTSFPFYVFFDSYSEFEKIIQVKDTGFDYDDLINYVPVGLAMYVSTAYTSSKVIVQVNKLGSNDPMATLVDGDFEIMKSNATPTVVITATDVAGAALGVYGLTIQKNNAVLAADLDATDYVIVQAHDDDATYFTHISNAVKLFGGA